MTEKRKLILAVLGTILFPVATFAFLAWSTTNECEKLQVTPIVPIYPQALLLETNTLGRVRDDYSLLASIMGIRSRFRLVSLEYDSDESPQNIIDFYEAQADCQGNFENSGRVVCTGNATPIGSYSVYIDTNSDLRNTTTFTIEIRWSACGSAEEI